MDIATVAGFIVGILCIAAAIAMGGSVAAYIDGPSFLIVLGGVVASTLVMFPLRTVIRSVGIAIKVFREDFWNVDDIINQMVGLSRVARSHGILALEDAEKSVQNPFLKRGLQLAVDGNEEGLIRFVMSTDLSFTQQRHAVGKSVFRQMGMMAPAFGMIGTLIGLVKMLQSMDDPSHIGPAMAIALLTTFYGALLANLIFLPIANKLDFRSKEEVLAKQIIIEGIVSILQGANPKVLKDKLESFLPPSQRRERRETPRGSVEG